MYLPTTAGPKADDHLWLNGYINREKTHILEREWIHIKCFQREANGALLLLTKVDPDLLLIIKLPGRTNRIPLFPSSVRTAAAAAVFSH